MNLLKESYCILNKSAKNEDFFTPHLESLLKFFGNENVKPIVAEGLGVIPEKAAKITLSF
ncbi:hypothetical protein ADMFC3_10070 [Geovibrio sp. ADMFC3]